MIMTAFVSSMSRLTGFKACVGLRKSAYHGRSILVGRCLSQPRQRGELCLVPFRFLGTAHDYYFAFFIGRDDARRVTNSFWDFGFEGWEFSASWRP